MELFWWVQYANAGLCAALKTSQKPCLIDGDSVSSSLYILECCFQLGDLYVQNVFCVINARFKPEV